MAAKGIYFATVVWGAEYRNVFTDICLPSILSPKNLPAVAKKFPIRFSIFTDMPGVLYLSSHPTIKALTELGKVQILLLDQQVAKSKNRAPTQQSDISKYDLSAAGYRIMLEQAQDMDAGFVMVSPDSVWADGSQLFLATQLEKGIRLVVTPGPRLSWEQSLPILSGMRQGLTLTISSRELTFVALNFMHWSGQTSFWNSNNFLKLPSHIYWRVADVGYLAHCFHLHPAMTYQPGDAIDLPGTMDDSFVCGFPEDETYIIQDSDEFSGYSLSFESQMQTVRGNAPASVDSVVEWARGATNNRHRQFFSSPTYFHFDGRVSPQWNAVVEEAQAISTQILDGLRN